MSFIALYLVFLKATATSFAGLASLPVIRDELIVKYHMITDAQLNSAIVITKSVPGPVGVYVVSVGYFAAGLKGATAAWLAMASPSLVIIALLRFFSTRAQHPRVRGMLQAVVITSAGLLINSAVPLARSALVDSLSVVTAAAAALALLRYHVDALWVLGAGALASLLASILSVPG